ncbi:MAG TPA: GTP-binding protein 8 [Vicinamibacterales bacterium]|nr:GTP-binding protein 8 [Vicinamibacterales bacterium]
MVGRSNVGKSSLINALVRGPVARTSAAPGKTRLANFYRVQPARGPAFYLVDLPGYGYARGGDAAGREFRQLAEAYFARGLYLPERLGAVPPAGLPERLGAVPPAAGRGVPRKELAAVLLVDARHPGLEADLSAWEWLQAQPIPTAVVATKVDKLRRAERVRHSRELDSLFAGPVRLVSSHTGEGLEELWKLIVTLPNPTATAEPEPPPPPRRPRPLKPHR